MDQASDLIKRRTYGWSSLKIDVSDNGSVVYFKATTLLTLNITSRAKDVQFRVRACLKRYKPVELREVDGLQVLFGLLPCSSRKALLQEICLIIDEIAYAHLTPKMVCESLGITAAQRTALTREGLLKSSGQASFPSDGKVGYYKLYSAHSVREIILGRIR
jgi:hypothetical protein